jgi:4-amino-4-deoxy-L-arabinose transferase-like glycosyltransferase
MLAPSGRLARLAPPAAALATLLLHALAWDRYGIFRDELYFIACGERLAFGYVDQPPGIPAVAALAHALAGTSVPGLRLAAWLASAGTVWLGARLAARLGGGGFAVALAALALVASPVLRALGHLLTMNAFEALLVVALAHELQALAAGTAAPRRWLAAGALAGGAVLFKYSAAMLAVALLLALLATPARRALRTRWALAGAALGLALVLPNLVWQAGHGYPFLELVRNGQLHKNAPFSAAGFAGALLLEGGPVGALVWTTGLGWLLVAPAARPHRFLGLGAGLYLAALLATRGKAYYFATALPVLLAAGAVALERAVRPGVARAAAAGALALQLALLPLAIPLLSEAALVRYLGALAFRPPALERDRQGALPQVFADMHGWERLAAAVERAYRGLPERERRTAVVFGQNYGQAAAVDVLAAGRAPPAVSGHNQYFLWGVPAGRGDPAIVIGDAGEDCGRAFREQVLVERLPPDPWTRPAEDERSIWVCRGATTSIEALWPRLKHYE